MKEIGCPTCGELFPVEVIVESMGIRETVRCQDAYHAAPAPGVPRVEERECSMGADCNYPECGATCGDTLLAPLAGASPETPAVRERRLADIAARVRLPLLDLMTHPNVPGGILRDVKRAFEDYVMATDRFLKDVPAPPPPTSEPSEEAVLHFNATLREIRSKFNGTENPPLEPGDLHRWASWLTEVETFLNAARRASRVEMTGENAGASAGAEPRAIPADAELLTPSLHPRGIVALNRIGWDYDKNVELGGTRYMRFHRSPESSGKPVCAHPCPDANHCAEEGCILAQLRGADTERGTPATRQEETRPSGVPTPAPTVEEASDA